MQDSPHNKDNATEAFLRLLGQHEPSLRRYILTLVLNWSDADDIAQETRLRLWQQFAQYDETKDFGAWARAIAYYVVLAHRKKATRQKRQLSEQFLTLMGREFERADSLEYARRDALASCLEKLTDYQRTLMAECYAPGATITGVASSLGRSVRGLQQTVAGIRALLHKCVQGVLEKEGRDG